MQYMDRIKACIIAALRNSPCTFEEIIRKSFGAYPSLVKQAMDDLKINNRLVPLYTTNEDEVPYAFNFEIDNCRSELVTYQIDNNPVLSSWYFSWHACKKIAQLDYWQDKTVLFLGTPRLFEYFVKENKARRFTLIDYDKMVTNRLRERYNASSYIIIENRDMNFLKTEGKDHYDCVFFDPPWYYNSYISWLKTASRLVAPDGKIMFPLFPYLLRPTASQERNDIFKISRRISKTVISIPEFLEYDISTFEKGELNQAGINLRANWKMADFIILQGVSPVRDELDNIEVDMEYLLWKEYSWFGMRWFIKEHVGDDNSGNSEQPLINTFGDSVFLKSPSKRNPELKTANVISSEGHGFIITNTKKFVSIMDEIQFLAVENKTKEIQTVFEKYSVDFRSRIVIIDLMK